MGWTNLPGIDNVLLWPSEKNDLVIKSFSEPGISFSMCGKDFSLKFTPHCASEIQTSSNGGTNKAQELGENSRWELFTSISIYTLESGGGGWRIHVCDIAHFVMASQLIPCTGSYK